MLEEAAAEEVMEASLEVTQWRTRTEKRTGEGLDGEW